MKISTFGGALLLFEFEDLVEAERAFTKGSRRVKENLLHLVKRMPEVGCLLKGGLIKKMWVRVLGLPLHLWSREVIKKIWNVCGGFIAMDEDTTRMTILQWARILVKFVGKTLPGELHVVIGSASFSFKLWWEAPPCFSRVVPRSCSSEHGLLEDRNDGAGGSRTSFDVENIVLKGSKRT